MAEKGGLAARECAARPENQPISRVLSRVTIHLGRTSPRASSDLPGSHTGRARSLHSELLPYLVLLRVGFTLPRLLPPARCALTAPFHPYRSPHLGHPSHREVGGMFSVALSVGSRPPGVTWHLALRSPDFPLQHTLQRSLSRLSSTSLDGSNSTFKPRKCHALSLT